MSEDSLSSVLTRLLHFFEICVLPIARLFSLLVLFILSCLVFFSLSFLCSFQGAVPLLKRLRSVRAGGDNEIRTRDLLLARQALSQLSYAPVSIKARAPKIEQ